MRYLITTPAPGRRLEGGRFALESAFAQHLRELKALLGPRFSEVVVVLSEMSEQTYVRSASGLGVINGQAEGFRLVTLYRHECTKFEFFRALPKILSGVVALTRQSDVLHVDYSYDLFRPVGALFCLAGWLKNKRVIAVDDIDRRRDAEMQYRMGRWPWRTYAICRFLYDPLRNLLYRAYVRMCDLMLFKELGQVRDFGRGANHVRLILDPNFGVEHVVDDEFVRNKIVQLQDPARPLKLLYFGRLVPYKGVDKMIEAVALAHRRGAAVSLAIMGAGEQRAALVRLASELGVADLINWLEPQPYGHDFFEVLRGHDVLMACPLSGDTPRSAWDALASGMPVIAFDTAFYRSMAEYSGAVETTPWPQVEPLAARLFDLARDKTQLAAMVSNAARTARANTSDQWMRRRNEWVTEICLAGLDSAVVAN